MSRSWLIDSRGLAKKVRNATSSSSNQIKDCGAKRECPECHYIIDNSDVSQEWPGLPAGVKFDPSDVELLEHLSAKCGVGDSKPHVFIDEFIPTLDSNEGICYTHPENLPCAKKDGNSVHFFYRTTNAYSKGQRKRRKITDENNEVKKAVRWHKTGKTKPLLENGVQKGYKKIMVLYSATKNGPKANWVMHQYHLGSNEDEKDGEFVVCKIFYQVPKHNIVKDGFALEESDIGTSRTDPRTPNTTSQPPRPGNTPSYDDIMDDLITNNLELESIKETKDDQEFTSCFAGESQAIEENITHITHNTPDTLLCNEIINTFTPFGDFIPNRNISTTNTDFNREENELMHANTNTYTDLENIMLDTPPEFQLTDLQFGSQDSLFGWLDRL